MFSSLPLVFGTTFREHSHLPALFLLYCPALCTLWGTEPVLPLDTDRNPLDTLSDIHSSLTPNLTKNSLCSFSRSLLLRFAPAIPPSSQDVTGAGTPQNSPYKTVTMNIWLPTTTIQSCALHNPLKSCLGAFPGCSWRSITPPSESRAVTSKVHCSCPL